MNILKIYHGIYHHERSLINEGFQEMSHQKTHEKTLLLLKDGLITVYETWEKVPAEVQEKFKEISFKVQERKSPIPIHKHACRPLTRQFPKRNQVNMRMSDIGLQWLQEQGGVDWIEDQAGNWRVSPAERTF